MWHGEGEIIVNASVWLRIGVTERSRIIIISVMILYLRYKDGDHTTKNRFSVRDIIDMRG